MEPEHPSASELNVWAAVGNIKPTRKWGPDGAEERSGTKHFRPGAKVFVIDAFWGSGASTVTVIGQHRKSRRFLCLHMPARHIENPRPKPVYSPAVRNLIVEYYTADWDGSGTMGPDQEYAERLCSAIRHWSSKRSPSELGRVVILPFLDISGERQEKKDECRETALSEVEERLRKYDIAYFAQAQVADACAALKPTPSDEEDRTKPPLKSLADRLNARFVVTGVIYNADSDLRRRGTFGEERKTGQAKVQFRVFDAAEERYVEELEMTANSTARAKGFSSGLFSRSSKLRVKAVRDATQKAMASFLAPYPKVHDEDPAKDE
jgi:hypothetical protein